MSGTVRIPDMPILGTPTDDSLIVGDHAGSGTFLASALRSYVMSGSGFEALTVSNLTVTGSANIAGDISARAATLSAGLTAAGDLHATNTVLTGGLSAANASLSGNLGAASATLSGQLNAAGASLTGNISAENVSLRGSLAAGSATFVANVTAGGALYGNGVYADSPTDTLFLGLYPGGAQILQWKPQYSMVLQPDGTTAWHSPTGTVMQLTDAGHLLLLGGNTSLGSFGAAGYLTINGSSDFSGGPGTSSLILNGGTRPTYGFEFYTGGTRLIAFDGAGAAYKPGGGSWADISDARIKHNVTDYTSGLAEVVQLRPVSYQYLPETGRGDRTYIGLIAQEVETVMPEMVAQHAGDAGSLSFPDLRVLDTTALLFALVSAVKELKQRVEQLEGAAP